MTNFKSQFYFLLIFLGTITSCKWLNTADDVLVAKSFDKYLYLKDLEGVVPANVHGNDSMLMIKSFIDQWQREQVMQHQAEENVKIDDKNIQRQLETYRKSLIRYQYEQELIAQKLDTVVTNIEIEKYYQENRQNFELKKPILKVSYIKLPPNAPKIAMVKKLFISTDMRDIDLLEKYCFRYSPNFSLLDTTWHYTEELEKIFPITKLPEDNFNNLNRIFEVLDNGSLYLIILRDAKFRDSLSPLVFEKENIKNLILNQRKLMLLNQMEKEVYEEALKKNELEIYDK